MPKLYNKFGKEISCDERQEELMIESGFLKKRPSEQEIADNLQDIEDQKQADADAELAASEARTASLKKKKEERKSQKADDKAGDKGGKKGS